MSRVAKNPIPLPQGVEVVINGKDVQVKGGKGSLSYTLCEEVDLVNENGFLHVKFDREKRSSKTLAGTIRALLNNMVVGVSKGFERKLELVGVGYKAQVQGSKVLNLSLGFSHPFNYDIPDGITIETPTVTEILIKGIDKEKVGQLAAELRKVRAPEPYKGKGVRYANEKIVLKETKKK